jgi:hypothetical protein
MKAIENVYVAKLENAEDILFDLWEEFESIGEIDYIIITQLTDAISLIKKVIAYLKKNKEKIN